MTILAVTSSLGNGYVKDSNAVYATAHAGTGTSNSVLDADMIVGQDNAGGTLFEIYRAFVAFDTSSIPTGATINEVFMTLDLTQKNVGGSDFDLQIVKYNWSAQSPITVGNRVAAFQGALTGTLDQIWNNTSAVTTATVFQSPDLDPTWVAVGGITYYSFLSSRDVSATTPSLSTNEWVKVAAGNNATVAFRPTLTVNYTEAPGNYPASRGGGGH